MRTLIKHVDRAAELLRLAVNAPRLDQEPFERVREQMNARLRRRERSGDPLQPGLARQVFPRPSLWPVCRRHIETLARIARADLGEGAKPGSRAIHCLSRSSARSKNRRRRRCSTRCSPICLQRAISSPFRARLSRVSGRSTGSISMCRNRRSVSVGLRSSATTRISSRASSPPMCWAARARYLAPVPRGARETRPRLYRFGTFDPSSKAPISMAAQRPRTSGRANPSTSPRPKSATWR